MCCHPFLHFKQTSGHRLHLRSLISSSDQTGADVRPLQMCPESPVTLTPGNSVQMNITHFPLFHISCYKAYESSDFPLKGYVSVHDIPQDRSSHITAAGPLQRQIKSGHSCGRHTCVVQAQEGKQCSHGWNRNYSHM